jgi:hypothetical protein
MLVLERQQAAKRRLMPADHDTFGLRADSAFEQLAQMYVELLLKRRRGCEAVRGGGVTLAVLAPEPAADELLYQVELGEPLFKRLAVIQLGRRPRLLAIQQ